MSNDTKVVILGTGTPNPDPDRMGPSVAVIVENNAYIVDAGVGVVRQATKASEKYNLDCLKSVNLKHVFLTHLHSDHTIGIPDLIFTPWVQGREDELNIYGPPGTKDMVDNIQKAYTIDKDCRMNGLEPINTTGYKTNVKEIENPEIIYKDEFVTVEALFADHMPFIAYSYKFTTKDKTIVISGDTSPAGGISLGVRECDILVHEVFSSQGLKNRTMEWAMYHGSVHTSSIDLGKVAEKVNPKKLVLYHQLFMTDKENEDEMEKKMIEEIRNNFDGEIISAKDLEIIS